MKKLFSTGISLTVWTIAIFLSSCCSDGANGKMMALTNSAYHNSGMLDPDYYTTTVKQVGCECKYVVKSSEALSKNDTVDVAGGRVVGFY